MSLYHFLSTNDKAGHEKFEKTIERGIDLSDHLHLMDEKTKQVLKSESENNIIYMWGAKPGEKNIPRWEGINFGDYVLCYLDGEFRYFGRIYWKTQNADLAKDVWGKNDNSQTWEYIFFIKDLIQINVTAQEFSSFFGYSNFNPQGFSNVREKILNDLIDEFGDVPTMIEMLNSNKMKKEEKNLTNHLEAFNEKHIEDIAFDSNDTDFIKFLDKLDHSASIELKKRIVKTRKYNQKIIKYLKGKYENRCQICGDRTSDDYGIDIVEAHHIEHFSLTQNNSPKNIMILCPNHHRLIHKAKGEFIKKQGKVIYSNGKEEELILNYHLKP